MINMKSNQTGTIKINEVKRYKNNAKLRPESQVLRIAKLILKYGFDDPIMIDENNELIKGHGRMSAIDWINKNTETKITDVPFIKKLGLTAEEKKAYRIGDNKVAESGWDEVLLKEEYEDILTNLDMEQAVDLFGTSEEDILHTLNRESNVLVGSSEAEEVKKLGSLVVQCPNCKHKFTKPTD